MQMDRRSNQLGLLGPLRTTVLLSQVPHSSDAPRMQVRAQPTDQDGPTTFSNCSPIKTAAPGLRTAFRSEARTKVTETRKRESLAEKKKVSINVTEVKYRALSPRIQELKDKIK